MPDFYVVLQRQDLHLKTIFNAALESVQPAKLIPPVLNALPTDSYDAVILTGAGKASAAMAAACENLLPDANSKGIIAVKYGHGLPLKHTTQIEAGHPLADENSVRAASAILDTVKGASKNELIIFLLSGGASALLTDLPGEFSIDDLNTVFKGISDCGASIHEINTVRKNLSMIKGGNLLRHINGTKMITLVISDVPGNDLSIIGSGPTFPDSSTPQMALEILENYNLLKASPPAVISYLKNNRQASQTTPITSDIHIIGDNSTALRAAEKESERLGYKPYVFDEFLTGDAELCAVQWLEKIKAFENSERICLIAGGETTVNIKGKGKGGRNQHFALATAVLLKDAGLKAVSVLSAGTDGTDGPTDCTGAIVNTDTCDAAARRSLMPEDFLSRNDSYHFFKINGGHIQTGPTQTNVMDVVITLIN